jgi:hypothetical protein
MWVKWKLISVSFEIVIISTQDRCMVCVGHAIDLVIILGAPDGTPKQCGSSGRSLRFSWRRCQSQRDRCKVGSECTIGMEIILGIPNRIPRLRGSNGSSFRSAWRFCQSQHKIGARFHQTYHRLRNQFGCTVCTECAIGSEIILGTPVGTPW